MMFRCNQPKFSTVASDILLWSVQVLSCALVPTFVSGIGFLGGLIGYRVRLLIFHSNFPDVKIWTTEAWLSLLLIVASVAGFVAAYIARVRVRRACLAILGSGVCIAEIILIYRTHRFMDSQVIRFIASYGISSIVVIVNTAIIVCMAVFALISRRKSP